MRGSPHPAASAGAAMGQRGWERGVWGGPLSSQPAVGCWELLQRGHPLTCLLSHTGVFHFWGKAHCHFLDDNNWVKFLDRNIYNWGQLGHRGYPKTCRWD